jgi:hypothetical protein
MSALKFKSKIVPYAEKVPVENRLSKGYTRLRLRPEIFILSFANSVRISKIHGKSV